MLFKTASTTFIEPLEIKGDEEKTFLTRIYRNHNYELDIATTKIDLPLAFTERAMVNAARNGLTFVDVTPEGIAAIKKKKPAAAGPSIAPP